MQKLKKYAIEIVLTCAFALTVLAHGIPTPIGYLSISTIAAGLGLLYTLKQRYDGQRPLIPPSLLSIPVVIATLVYFGVGLSSVAFADEPRFWLREVLQRTLIIFLPMFLFSLMPKKPGQLKWAILAYLPLCALLSIISIWDARSSGFAKPVYALGMHKNHIAGSCSVMATIAIAALLTTRDLKRRYWMIFFLVVGTVGCVAAQGKAGMCCILIATAFMFIANGARVRNVLYFVVAVSLVGTILWKIMPQESIDHVVSTKKFSTNEIRLTLWTDVVPVLIEKPFSAVGWGNILVKEDRYYGDCANVLLYDWFQMTIFGPIALLGVIFFAVKLPFDNARRMPKTSLLAFINLVALGVICGRFFHGMVDTFWIGRGVTLVTWAAIGMSIFVKLYLDQLDSKKSISLIQTPLKPRLNNGNRAVVR